MLPYEQIEGRGITDARVVGAMRSVPRELFVPAELRRRAYEDTPLNIGYGVTISQPFIVGMMSQLLDTSQEHRVLEIGTGSGYQTAILSRLCKQVFSIEVVPELARSSEARLKQLGFDNVTIVQGDGYGGWPSQAPFDRIVLTAAPAVLPTPLIEQLKPGGRLVAPVGRHEEQHLIVVNKSLPVMFVPMVSE